MNALENKESSISCTRHTLCRTGVSLQSFKKLQINEITADIVNGDAPLSIRLL